MLVCLVCHPSGGFDLGIHTFLTPAQQSAIAFLRIEVWHTHTYTLNILAKTSIICVYIYIHIIYTNHQLPKQTSITKTCISWNVPIEGHQAPGLRRQPVIATCHMCVPKSSQIWHRAGKTLLCKQEWVQTDMFVFLNSKLVILCCHSLGNVTEKHHCRTTFYPQGLATPRIIGLQTQISLSSKQKSIPGKCQTIPQHYLNTHHIPSLTWVTASTSAKSSCYSRHWPTCPMDFNRNVTSLLSGLIPHSADAFEETSGSGNRENTGKCLNVPNRIYIKSKHTIWQSLAGNCLTFSCVSLAETAMNNWTANMAETYDMLVAGELNNYLYIYTL